MSRPIYSLDHSWHNLLADLLENGCDYQPRGLKTKDLMGRQFHIDMRYPVLTDRTRKLSYRFMAAEAYWILTGDDRVATIAPYNKNIAKFSDDGVRFFGAYGTKIMPQLNYVVEKLKQDKDTRQAVLTIWRENPPETNDVPCTVAIQFRIRNDKFLFMQVFMRSSDAWLGVPYDTFNFSMLGHLVCCRLMTKYPQLVPGALCITMGSSHLYETNAPGAIDVIQKRDILDPIETPVILFTSEEHLMYTLAALRDSRSGDDIRWWE